MIMVMIMIVIMIIIVMVIIITNIKLEFYRVFILGFISDKPVQG